MKRRWNIVRKDETLNGVFWPKIGTLVEFDNGDMKLRLHMFPQPFHVFLDNEDQRKARATQQKTTRQADEPPPFLDDDIPF